MNKGYTMEQISIRTITPEMARAILKRNEELFAVKDGSFRQRKISTNWVQTLAKDMKEGRWQLNGDTIVFDEKGRLIDGQHRLSALIEADMPIQFIVVGDIGNAVMPSIDIPKCRTVSNNITISGEESKDGAAAIVRNRMHLDIGLIADSSRHYAHIITKTEMAEEYIRNRKKYDEAATYANDVRNATAKVMNISEVGAIFLHLTDTLGYPEDFVKAFFDRLASVRMNEKSIYKTTMDRLANKRMCIGGERYREYVCCWNSMIRNHRTLRLPVGKQEGFIKPQE